MLAAVVLLLLITPVHVVLRLAGDAERGVEVALSWRFLLLNGARSRRLDLTTPPPLARAAGAAPAPLPETAAPPAPRAATTSPRAAATTSAPPTASTSSGSPAPARPRLRERLGDAELALGVVRRLLVRRALRVTGASGWLELALRDVGETGRAFGFACALATLLDPEGRLELRPRWDTEDWIAADLALELRVHPLRTAWILLCARRRRRTTARTVTAAPNRGVLAA